MRFGPRGTGTASGEPMPSRRSSATPRGRLPSRAGPRCSSRARRSSNLRSSHPAPRLGHARRGFRCNSAEWRHRAAPEQAVHDVARRRARQAIAAAEHRQRGSESRRPTAPGVECARSRRRWSSVIIRDCGSPADGGRRRVARRGPTREAPGSPARRDRRADFVAHLTAQAGRQLVHSTLEVGAGRAANRSGARSWDCRHRLLRTTSSAPPGVKRADRRPVGDREVHLVADRRHDRHLRGGDRAGDVVEAQRSGRAPPRPTMITSTSPGAFRSRSPCAILGRAVTLTRHGAITMCRSPKRRRSRAGCLSRRAGRGHDAIFRGIAGLALAAGSKSLRPAAARSAARTPAAGRRAAGSTAR